MYSIYTVYLSYCYIIWRTNYELIVSYMPDKPVFSNKGSDGELQYMPKRFTDKKSE